MSGWDRCCLLAALRQQIEDALTLARLAAAAYRSTLRDCASSWHSAAERYYELILAEIAGLTDEEADLLEPEVTELEEELCRLWPVWMDQTFRLRQRSPVALGAHTQES